MSSARSRILKAHHCTFLKNTLKIYSALAKDFNVCSDDSFFISDSGRIFSSSVNPQLLDYIIKSLSHFKSNFSFLPVPYYLLPIIYDCPYLACFFLGIHDSLADLNAADIRRLQLAAKNIALKTDIQSFSMEPEVGVSFVQ